MSNKIKIISTAIALILLITLVVRGVMVYQYTNNILQISNYFFNAEKRLPKFSETLHDIDQFENQKPQLLLFYKVGCPLCNAAHPALSNELKQLEANAMSRVQFVNLDSEAGEKLSRKFNVEVAATMVLVTNEQPDGLLLGQASSDGEGTIKVNSDAIKFAFQNIR